MAQILDIADAVVAELNAETFTQDFTAVRRYVPRYEPKDIKELTVTVIPGPQAVEQAARDAGEHDYTIMVGVQIKLDSQDAAEVDPMVGLVEEIADFLAAQELADVPEASCLGATNEEPYIPELMDQFRVFTSFVVVNYRMLR